MTKSKIKDAFERLNDRQQQAVKDNSTRLLLLAGAGSGKTSTLVVRVCRHLMKDKFHPREIVGLTFTNKAGTELKERVKDLLGDRATEGMFIGTFHSFCVRILRKNFTAAGLPQNFQILDEGDKKSLLKTIWKKKFEEESQKLKDKAKEHGWSKTKLADLQGELKKFYAELKAGVNLSITALGYIKNRGLGHEWIKRDMQEKVEQGQIPETVADFTVDLCQRYEERKDAMHMLDFDDLIIRTNQMLKNSPEVKKGINTQIRSLLIDEFQDTNIIQYELMKLLVTPQTMLTVVGDEDQLIYEWRGAILSNILKFCEAEGGTLIKMEQNYRSTRSILGGANSLISNNEDRLGKTLFTENKTGEAISQCFFANAYDEAEDVVRTIVNLREDGAKLNDVAIIYRNNSMSGAIGNILHRHNLPAIVYGGLSFWERKEIKDIMSYLKWIDTDANSFAINRILTRMKIGFGEKKHIEIEKFAEKHSITYGAALKDFATSGKASKLKTELKTVIGIKEHAEELYKESGLGEAVKYISRHAGFTDIYKRTEEEETVVERVENMYQLEETAQMFDHEEVDEAGVRLDDLSVFLTNADLQVEAQNNKDKDADSVSLMTIHASKGLEYKYVFIIGVEDAYFPSPMRKTRGEIEEERRLAYVAITRAKSQLWMSGARNRLNKQSMGLSKFAKEIESRYKIVEDKSIKSAYYY